MQEVLSDYLVTVILEYHNLYYFMDHLHVAFLLVTFIKNSKVSMFG